MTAQKGKMDLLGRQCTKCGRYKHWNEFHKHLKSSSGYYSECKACATARSRKYYRAHAEQRREDSKRYRAAHPEYVRQKNREWNYLHPTYRQEYDHQRRAAYLERQRKYNQKRSQNPQCRVNKAMSCGIWKSLKGKKGGQHWQSLVPYNSSELRQHLEDLFEPDMSWGNYGEWQIDHIKPRSAFKFKTAKSKAFQACWALSNLMPRWKTTAIAQAHHSTQIGNYDKHDKSLDDMQPRLL